MTQTNDQPEYDDQSEVLIDREIDAVENWRDEHGMPDFEYLQALVDNNEPIAREKLHRIAEDLDVNFDPNSSPKELVEIIRLAVKDGPNITT